ncbi:MAG: hypothetical protein FRX48_02700 [Lasallia pustulata]|uniref:Uncharacterized protein n=1 Tax=Lasallia pustulata TaxID=136370 RepID=A0A5M8PXH6_9LECA|nr:MAG: hypothetical protein FRX48_02700 [Lasallia pustulata]
MIMASKMVKGRSEHVGAVASRSHKPEKIFPVGPNADEVLIFGTVSYGLKNRKSKEITWAARAHLVKDGAEWKMDYYQVYLNDAAQNASK